MIRHHALFAPLRAAAAGRAAVAIGIDLGTTNSAIARAGIDAEGAITVECLREDGDDPRSPVSLPSVVAVDGERLVVGRDARRLLGERHESAQGKSVFAETKNEIGLAYTYWKAPEELDDAAKVAAFVLQGLADRCDASCRDALSPTVIGVPAAFQGTQRSATLAAAEAAGMDNGDGIGTALIDEPVAIFLDALHSGALDDVAAGALRRVLVFDFGGGTCDVALFDLALDAAPPRVTLRGTSRYHRLGGGDIDRALVHQVLLPQLLAQNRLQALDLGWRQKKRELEPGLLLVAEGLKQTLCRRLATARAQNRRLDDDTEMVDTRQHRFVVGGKTLWLENATLTLPAFRKMLEPFLDPAGREPAPNEYFSARSIFAPIASLTERLRVDAASVDAVVFGGGSSLVPPVRDAVLRHFPKARAIGTTDPEQILGAVARGAALQALSFGLTGTPLIRPVTGIDVAIRTTESLVALVEEGEALPIAARRVSLAAPRASAMPLDISVELVGATHRLLFRQTWTLPPPVKAGEPLDLTLSVDENQTAQLRLARRNGEADDFRRALQSPLSHTDASHKVRMRVLEREERIRRGAVDDADRGVEFRRLAEDYGELRQWEKAIDAMRTAIAAGEDGATSLNQIGVWYGRLQDRDREEQCYRHILEVEPFTHAMFNLALARRERGDLAEARAMIERACRIDPDEPCYRILKADLARRGGDVDTSRKLIEDLAQEAYKPEQLSDWQLGWFEAAANLAGDSAWQVQLKLERERRKGKPQEARVGVLPAAGPAAAVSLRDAG